MTDRRKDAKPSVLKRIDAAMDQMLPRRRSLWYRFMRWLRGTP